MRILRKNDQQTGVQVNLLVEAPKIACIVRDEGKSELTPIQPASSPERWQPNARNVIGLDPPGAATSARSGVRHSSIRSLITVAGSGSSEIASSSAQRRTASMPSERQRGIVVENLLARGPAANLGHDCHRRNAGPAHAGHASHDVGIDAPPPARQLGISGPACPLLHSASTIYSANPPSTRYACPVA